MQKNLEIIDLREGIKIKQNRKNQRQPTWKPLEIQITIKPNTENVHVQIDLVVKCRYVIIKLISVRINLLNYSIVKKVTNIQKNHQVSN